MNKKQRPAILMRMGVLAAFILAAGCLCAASIEVTNPVGNYSFVLNGRILSIEWKQDGALPNSGQVRISLRNQASTTEIQPIAESAPNNGTYEWQVPLSLVWKKYVVRVKLKGEDARDDSDPFAIVPDLWSTNPDGYDTLEETKTYDITWIWKGPVPDTKLDITIQDIEKTKAKITIAEAIPANGHCLWTVAGNIPIGTYHMAFYSKKFAWEFPGAKFYIVLAKPHVPKKVKK